MNFSFLKEFFTLDPSFLIKVIKKKKTSGKDYRLKEKVVVERKIL